MDFAFSPDQQLLRSSARAFLDEHMTPATVRLLWDDPRGERETTWKEMARLGGGIGFTWEYDLHLYVKRAKALEAMYGDAEYHRELIVRRVAA